MDIEKFSTEAWFGRFEFEVEHLLASSDCETLSVGALLRLAGVDAEALLSQRLGYSDSHGDPELRAAIASTYQTVEVDDVVVVAAPEEGIFLAMHALLAPSDAVVVMTPCYDSLRNVASHIGASVHPFALEPTEQGWTADIAAFERLVQATRPRLVVLNVPHNPTGYLPTAGCFRRMLDIARDAGAIVFSDEMYRGLELSGSRQLPSAVDHQPAAIVLGGLSKAHGLPGLRCGWLTVRDREIRDRLVNWKHYTTICSPVASQFLSRVALQVADRLMHDNRTRIERNVAHAQSMIAQWPGFELRAPQAGSVALLETPWDDAVRTCEVLAKRGVLLLPGACMGAPASMVRLGFGRDGFQAGLAALETALTSVSTG